MNTIKVPFEIYRQAVDLYMFEVPPFDDFIFQDFKLVLEGFEDINLFVSYIVEWRKKEWQSMIFTIYENGKNLGKYQWIMEDGDNTKGALAAIPPRDVSEREGSIARGAARRILLCMYYIMNYPREHKKERLSSHRYSHEHKVSTRQNKIYLFDDIVKYVSEKYVPEGGHHSIQCPCWEVRGHYRHYRSGKVVFIQSYRKGKDKDTAQPKPKQYIASSGKDYT